MLKTVILFLLLINLVSAQAQTWSDIEINALQSFTLKSLPSATDPSNKFISDISAINFGKAIFDDKRFSSNGKVSCSSCHIKEYAFTDKRKLSFGLREGFRNTPTLFNVGSQSWFFADGAKDSLWAQALSSIENPAEQNYTRTETMQFIANDDVYRKQYRQIFGNELPNTAELRLFPEKAGPNAKLEHLIAWKKLNNKQREIINTVFTNIGKVIAAYVASIESSETRFDEFIEELNEFTQSRKLDDSEQRGLRLFMSQESGCANCHSGPQFSNKSFHDVGTGIPGKDNGRSEVIESVVRDEFNCLSQYSDANPNECLELRYINRDKHQVTGAYKTSTLRGLSKTAPYIHDGRHEKLNDVIKHYISASQKKNKDNDLTPISLNEKQQTDLVNFLLTL